MTVTEVIFATVGGLRGAVSLILAQMVVTEQNPRSENQKVTAEVRSPAITVGLRWDHDGNGGSYDKVVPLS
jgi:NhaP-type Na+/H+ or K+/H+ antiporter